MIVLGISVWLPPNLAVHSQIGQSLSWSRLRTFPEQCQYLSRSLCPAVFSNCCMYSVLLFIKVRFSSPTYWVLTLCFYNSGIYVGTYLIKNYVLDFLDFILKPIYNWTVISYFIYKLYIYLRQPTRKSKKVTFDKSTISKLKMSSVWEYSIYFLNISYFRIQLMKLFTYTVCYKPSH